jgi:hypothetical protein
MPRSPCGPSLSSAKRAAIWPSSMASLASVRAIIAEDWASINLTCRSHSDFWSSRVSASAIRHASMRISALPSDSLSEPK